MIQRDAFGGSTSSKINQLGEPKYFPGGRVREHSLLLPRIEVPEVRGDRCQISKQIPPGFCCSTMELFDGVFLQLDEKRIYVYNTLFNLPEIYLLACLIDYFQTNENYKE